MTTSKPRVKYPPPDVLVRSVVKMRSRLNRIRSSNLSALVHPGSKPFSRNLKFSRS